MDNDVAIGIAESQSDFELNVYKQVVIFNFLKFVDCWPTPVGC